MIELIQVCSDEPQNLFCHVCDTGLFQGVTKWYRPNEVDSGHCRIILECCKDKVGKVVDWEEYSPMPFYKAHGIKV